MSTRSRAFVVLVALLVAAASHSGVGAPQAPGTPPGRPGQTATQLADGRWLILGGTSSNDPGRIVDVESGAAVPIAAPRTARLWHTATLLADGSVLILGGVNERGQIVAAPEVFNPATGQFTALEGAVAAPRARHTATLLTDGRVLLLGGDIEAGGVSAEVWDHASGHAYPVAAPAASRRSHRAQLLADGRVLIEGGFDANGGAIDSRELFEAGADVFRPVEAISAEPAAAELTGSNPADGAVNVPANVRVVLRFGEPIDVRALRHATISVDASGSTVETTLVPAEGGRLLFVNPARPFEPGAAVTLTAEGLRSSSRAAVAPIRLAFTVATPELPMDDPRPLDPDLWVPRNAKWRSERSEAEWRRLAPLQAAKGVTALAGQVLRLDGRPLSDVTLEIEGQSVRSDRTGRFLLVLNGVEGGWHELVIEGKSANRAAQRFGRFEYGLSIVKGRTNILPSTIWMPVLDTANAMRIESPTRAETVITTPHIPGLELHLPAGTTITDDEGKTVREISITPIPIDRTPFPLPNGVQVPIYFTIQPGGAYVHVANQGTYKRGAWLVYPNYSARPVGERLPFWLYDAEENGWHVYGFGRVNSDGRQISPERGTYVYEFTGAMIGVERDPPADPPGDGEDDGDPVDLATGLFIMEKTDLFLPDVIPLVLKRTYRTNDDGVRPFGVGTQHPYDLWFDNQVVFQEADLILPDATRIHYVRTSPGTGPVDAVFEHTTTPTAFYGSKVTYNGNGWDLTMKDGTVFVFGVEAPLQSIRDRFGNTVTITRTGGNLGNIARITSPNGRYIEFTYDTSNRVTQANDNIGRTVTYTYNTAGCLSTVTDAKGGVTEYTYDAAHRLLTAEDARNIVYLENEYDTAGKVIRQTQGDGGEYEFDYTINGSGQVTQTDVTNPRGFVRRVMFNAARYVASDTRAFGETEEQTTTYTRLAGSQLIDTITDELGRVTKVQYDTRKNISGVTKLYGTADANTTSFAYDSVFNLVNSITDPLSHTWSVGYDSLGRLVSSADPLNHTTTFTTNAAGQVTSLANPLSHQVGFTYELGDLTAVQSPLGTTREQFVDGAGRVTRIVGSLGLATTFTYDASDQITQVTDARGGQTSFTYDANGNLLTMTDGRGKVTTWTYNDMDRIATRTDPLNREESFAYDLNGNMVQWTDAKGQVTVYEYDALNRQTFAGFNATGAPPAYESTVSTTYDAGNRIVELIDSGAGTITRTYDLLDRRLEEETPEGMITYTYDAAGRRATMQVAGQTGITYTHDAANRLTGITQGTASVVIAYDNASRRTSLTLPNGIVVEYGYDEESRLTGLTYKLGSNVLGNLTYTYDANGQRVQMGGSWARINLPPALASAVYDDANQIATWATTNFTYDDNGNVTSDGSKTYTWNARNELTALGGAITASFAYDAIGRRRLRTIGGDARQYLYDDLNAVQELVSGTPTAHLLTGPRIDEYLARTDSVGTVNYLADGLGSSVALANGTGTVQTEYTYEPFGAFTASGSLTANTFAFTGREADTAGLYFHRARYYDPRLQRFATEDPAAKFSATSSFRDTNRYLYARQDPVSLVDPDGRNPIFFGAALIVTSAAYLCSKAAVADGKKFFPGNDKKQHCFTSCQFTRCFGSPLATFAGGIIHELVTPWQGWESVQDIKANLFGIWSSNPFNFKSCRASCEACPVR